MTFGLHSWTAKFVAMRAGPEICAPETSGPVNFAGDGRYVAACPSHASANFSTEHDVIHVVRAAGHPEVFNNLCRDLPGCIRKSQPWLPPKSTGASTTAIGIFAPIPLVIHWAEDQHSPISYQATFARQMINFTPRWLQFSIKTLVPQRLEARLSTALAALLAERAPDGHWVGQLSASAAGLLQRPSVPWPFVQQHTGDHASNQKRAHQRRPRLGWRPTKCRRRVGATPPKASANISTSMLCRAALHLTGGTQRYRDNLNRVRSVAFRALRQDASGTRRKRCVSDTARTAPFPCRS